MTMRQLSLAVALAAAGVLTGLAGAGLFATPAHAQIGNPAGMSPSTPESEPGKPAPGHPNTQDRLFIYLMAAGGMAEVEASRLADGRTSGPLRDFARRMVQEHGASNDQLARLAQQNRVPLPERPDPDHRAMQARLQALNGVEFERAYLQGQIVDHQKTATLLQWEIAMGQDAGLQRYAAATLPTVLQHLQDLHQMHSQMTGTPPQGLSAALMPPARPAESRP
jgi:putative membrane protein